MPGEPQEVGPQEIIEAIILNFRKTILPSRFVNYFNNEYVVLLDRTDFDRLKPFTTSIREEAIKALDQELADMSRSKGWLGKKEQTRYTSNGPWQIQIMVSENDEVRAERIVVDSKPSLSAESSSLEGPATVTVNRPAPGVRETERAHFAPPQSADVRAYATLAFEDSTGTRQVYEMRKDLIKVGRGGPPDVWVDVSVLSSTDISREHFEIRRESETGRFFIKDLSRFGTWVNDKKVAPSNVVKNGSVTYLEVLEPLPAKARINLANVLTMEFRASTS